jgi:hypothetical protein
VISISPAALRTAGGLLTAAAGKRHGVHQFLMEWPIAAGEPCFRSFRTQEFRPPALLRHFQETSQKLRHEAWLAQTAAVNAGASEPDERECRILSMADLKFIDLLFCDTIAHAFVKHRNNVKSQLLSDESLREIASVAEPLSAPKRIARVASSQG